ncbi:tetratricopeptide repeat protein [Thalassospira alkalitolerans]|uniref:tetratricopeptide repeat protein n=1 Tax=Thalassospira alkalitolerans TaxID=1293890 RepID=UPI003AA8441C
MSKLPARKFLRASSSLIVMIVFGMTMVPFGTAQQARAQGTDMTADDAQQYQACLKLARLKPEDGFESAIAWRDMGGGEPAKHCVAVALIALEKYEEAATRLNALADESTSPQPVIAGLLAQAGQSWMMAGNLEFAWRDQTRALKIVQNDPTLWVDRAMVLGMAGQYWDSIDDLNAALDIDPDNVEALIYRGTAWRMLETYDLAMSDIEHALELSPRNVQALFERANLHRINKDKDLARRDYLTVIENSNGTPVADAARANIEKMDVHTGSE